MKNLNYLFPMENPNHLKIFQGSNSKIYGVSLKRSDNIIKFLKDNYKEFIFNSGIYILVSKNEDERYYIGQTINGISRIEEHNRNKEFWDECIIFLTENNTWDKTIIDYLEYSFIKEFNKSMYTLENKDMRSNKPVLDLFQESSLSDIKEEILFMLSCNDISLREDKKITSKVYKAGKGKKANLMYENGKFILLSGSEISYPKKEVENWSDGGKFYRRQHLLIDEYVEQGKVREEGDKLLTIVDIAFTSASSSASIVTGLAENGYVFWQGLDEIRKNL